MSIVKQRSAKFNGRGRDGRAAAPGRRNSAAGDNPEHHTRGAAAGAPHHHAKVNAKLREIEELLPQIRAEFERLSVPCAELSPALRKLIDTYTQLQAVLGVFKSDEIATEAQICRSSRFKRARLARSGSTIKQVRTTYAAATMLSRTQPWT